MTARGALDRNAIRPAFHVLAYVLLKYSFASSLYSSALAASSGVAGVTDATSPLSPILRACLRACACSRAALAEFRHGCGPAAANRRGIEVTHSHAVATCVTRDRASRCSRLRFSHPCAPVRERARIREAHRRRKRREVRRGTAAPRLRFRLIEATIDRSPCARDVS